MPKSIRKRKIRTYRRFDQGVHALNFKFEYNPVETAALSLHLEANTRVNVDDLRRVSLWKSNRVLNVSSETLEKLRRVAKNQKISLEDKESREAIEALVASDGIGFPMASAILKFINPKVYPIIDVRAYRAFTGSKPFNTTYTFKKYVEYAKGLQKIADSCGRPLREIDEQLYCFDQKHNGKI